ncbi:hypothetical protein R1flu_028990 [Riccia fluitans]|uniref:Uncharacterized protein n=1 Tax=Riccia fluitans TaxID=41844 RepID=A0ABD1XN86_9MARC
MLLTDHPVSRQVWRAILCASALRQPEFVSQLMNSSPFRSLVHTARDEDDYTDLYRVWCQHFCGAPWLSFFHSRAVDRSGKMTFPSLRLGSPTFPHAPIAKINQAITSISTDSEVKKKSSVIKSPSSSLSFFLSPVPQLKERTMRSRSH